MLIEMRNIVKTYGKVVANNDVSISLNKGEILAVIGENGAGKSTITKILYGLEKFDSGEILVRGEKVHLKNPKDAMNLGIGMVQQHFMLFDEMTVYENIIYNNELSKSFGVLDKKANIENVRSISEKYGLPIDPNAIVSDCSVGTQQRVEILKTLYQNADVIIFDEPSAVLTPGEVDELIKTMKQLAKMGKSLIIITHKLREVMEVADRVVVMRSGQVVHETKIEDTNMEDLSYHMIGRQVANKEYVPLEVTEKILEVNNVTYLGENGKKILDDINIHVGGGEIVGIAGVSGSGQSELIRCIAGLDKEYRGKITLCGNDITGQNVDVVRKAGLAHIPEDRYYWGSAKDATLKDNALMGFEDSDVYSKKGILKHDVIEGFVDSIISDYKVKAHGRQQKIGELSGGNAQKLITGREIGQKTPLLIACEPTRGVDIGAMEFIHDKLLEKRNEKDGILLVSSELSEILKLSDRIYVMYDGKISHEFKQGNVDDRKLGIVMMGGSIDE
ncbi:MAG: ABC transporter ATP-binding protein [Peptostreptococcaceae bacterium]